MTKPRAASVADRLRQAIRDSGQSLYAIAKATGVSNPILYRFMSGKRDLTLGTADRLCRYLGLELRRARGKG